MSDATFTFRVEESLKEQFTPAAKGRYRSGAQLLRDFMRECVLQQQSSADHDAWFRQQVQAGLDSANAGNLVSAADVEAQFAARRAATSSKI
jgi:predicted transcriptional regulator